MIVKKILLHLRRVFEIDLRTLGLLRISLGIVLIWDWFVRYRDMVAHYTDFGVLPRGPFLESFSNPHYHSLFFLTGTNEGVHFLFFLYAIAIILFTIGYRSRLTTFICWLFVISFNSRNPMVIQGGDILLRVMLFWCLFLPLGARFSVDRFFNPKDKEDEPRYFSAATIAIILQVVAVYVCTALLKTGVEWHKEGSAVYFALHIDQHARPLGIWFRQFIEPMRWMTWITCAFELYGPLILASPVWFGPLRFLGAIGFVLLHIGFGAFLDVGLFTFIGPASSMVFLPTWFWDKWGREKSTEKVTSSFHPVTSLIVVYFFVAALMWNWVSFPGQKWSLPEFIRVSNLYTRLDQYWSMFAPYPLKDDGWFVIRGTLVDGAVVDVYNKKDGEPSFDKPEYVYRIYPNDRWRKYLMNLWNRDNADYRLHYGRYLCRDWNTRAIPEEKKLNEFEIFYMREDSVPPGQEQKVEKVRIWHHGCFKVPTT